MKIKVKAKLMTIIGMSAALTILSGCCLSHDYSPATCIAPATCTKCGKTDGEALGHTWVEATCTEPKTCSVCGETDGEALGHTWVDPTCTEPKTCSVCGETEGEALGHAWAFATVDAPKTCTVCGETEGTPVTCTVVDLSAFDGKIIYYLGIDDRNVYYEKGDTESAVIIASLDGTELSRLTFNSTYGWSFVVGKFYIEVSFTDENGTIWYTTIYDYDGNEILYKEFSVSEYPLLDGGILYVEDNGKTAIKFYDASTDEDLGYYYDTAKGTEITKDEYQDEPEPAFDTSEYSLCLYQQSINGYFIATEDGKWGYTDADGNVIALYADATEFSASGYALISEAGGYYSIIDSEFNIVGENLFEGNGSSLNAPYTDAFRIFSTDIDGNDIDTYLTIK